MEILIFTFNDFFENTFILLDETKECLIVDPGCITKSERKLLTETIEAKGLKPVGLINTHCHIDHVLGNQYVHTKYGLPLQAHKIEETVLSMQNSVAKMYGIPYETSPEISIFLEEKQNIIFGDTELEVLFVPGHSPGHICLFDVKGKQLIAGDTLFKGSIGRTDLPGGHHATLLLNIKSKLLSLPDEVIVYSGHGDSTTIGEEKRTNPFF